MRDRRRVLAIAATAALMAAATPSPAPPPPVFELHRTAAASHVDPTAINPLFVLIIGSDMREGYPAEGRADSLQLIAVNTETAHGTVVGIPRDTWVPVPGFGSRKITESLYYRGPQGTVEAVQTLTGIPIHYWAMVEFSRFRALVDQLGGLTIDVPYPMADPWSGAYFDQGPHHMDGTELLAFARNRHGAPQGDLGRAENGSRALMAALTAFRAEATSPLGMLRYVEAFHTHVTTDVPLRDLLALGSMARRLDPQNMTTLVAPVRFGNVGGASVVFLEPAAHAIFDSIRHDGVP